MIDSKKLTKELLSLTNLSELTEQQIAQMKNLICYLSEIRKNGEISSEDLPYLEVVLYAASVKLRTFGYNRQNNLHATDLESDLIITLKEACIAQYYRTETGFVLDRMQKLALDTFEDGNQRLFLSAPTSFGKTFLLKEILFRHSNEYHNIIIVLPTVALLMEVTEDLSEFFYKHNLSYKVHNSVYRDLELEDRNVFVLTPERVLRLLALKSDLCIDFFFYDEIYKIDEDFASENDEDSPEKIVTGEKFEQRSGNNHRAVAFRLALYYLLQMASACYLAGPFISMKTLKSGFKNMLRKYSITPLEVYFEPTLKNRIDYHTTTIHTKTPFTETQQSTGKKSKRDKLKYIVQYLQVDIDNPAIVFCLYPGYTETYARAFCEEAEEVQSQQIKLFIDHVSRNFNCHFDNGSKASINHWDFLYALNRGVGIHNGKFPKYFQREIMSIFNQRQLPLLFCTSTIVEGVNTNAKTVIVYNNPSGENDAGRKFLLLNINGRAGRYLRHFVGNIVYLDKDTLKIEIGEDISLDFKIFSDQALLSELDLENVEFEDVSPINKERKSSIELDVQLLPDAVFSQNRLIERKTQEAILKILCQRLPNFYGIERASILHFINGGYFDSILRVWADVGEIKPTQIPAIKYFSKNYADNGYLGVLQYRFNKYAELHKANEPDSKFVNDTYRIIFRDVKDTIEYQLPRILSLFETLIDRAFVLTGKPLAEPLDLSKVIRYFEIGAKTLLGADMIEKGVPIITVRKLEQKEINGDTLREQQTYFFKNRHFVQSRLSLDAYEQMQINKYCTLIESRQRD
ncbi:MAG: DEAD/DEAH box helicase [Oscillospiraceae bacterium]|nr:DEAD/DEAH box helicase [Oscillospiraceae bacterium]